MLTKSQNALFVIYLATLLLAIAIVPNLPQLDFIANWQDPESIWTIRFFQFISDSISYFSIGIPALITIVEAIKIEERKDQKNWLSLLILLILGLIPYLIQRIFSKPTSDGKRNALSFLYVVLSIAVAGLISYAMKKTFLEPRPYEVDTRIAQLSVGGGYSLPSGHTTEAFASAMALTLLFPRWFVFIPMFTWASVVALSRIYLGVHYPFDIFVGMFIGSSISFSFYTFLFRKYLNLSSTKQLG